MKSIIKTVSAAAFVLASGLSFAGQPVSLSSEDMDQVNAGLSMTLSNGSSGSSYGLLAATSTSWANVNIGSGSPFTTSTTSTGLVNATAASGAINSLHIHF